MKSRRDKKLLDALGKRIRELRVSQGISQAQLAYESGIHRDQIGRIELGKQSSTITVLASIAGALDVELTEMLAPIKVKSLILRQGNIE